MHCILENERKLPKDTQNRDGEGRTDGSSLGGRVEEAKLFPRNTKVYSYFLPAERTVWRKRFGTPPLFVSLFLFAEAMCVIVPHSVSPSSNLERKVTFSDAFK